VQQLQPREFVSFYDLAEAEDVLGTLAGPVEILDSSMYENPLERHCLGQTDCLEFLSVLRRQQRRPQQRRTSQVRMVIGKGAELDHGAMLPQGFSQGQNQKGPSFQGDSPNVDQALTRISNSKSRLFRSGSMSLIYCNNLVAGAGFEPAAFRL
jgi:hypothetical protein